MPDSVPPAGTFAIPELVKETTTTTGAVGVGSRYNLQGAVAGRLSVGSQLSDGTKATFCVKDGESPPDYEVFEGHYVSASDEVEVDRLLQTSNGNSAVTWPGSGSREIFITFVARTVEQITDPDASAGLVTNTAAGGHTYARRTLTVGTADFLSISDGNGAGGNPTFNKAYSVLRRSGGSEAERSMSNYITLLDTTTKIQDGGFPHSMHGSGGSSADIFLKIIKNGAGDFTLQSHQGGTLYDLLTQNQVSEWLPALKFANSLADGDPSTNQPTLQGNTEVSWTAPATGTYFALMLGLVMFDFGSPGGGNTRGDAIIQSRHGAAGSWTDIAAGSTVGANDVAGGQMSANANHAESLSASTTHRWRLSCNTSGPDLHADDANDFRHFLGVLILRTA